MGGITVRFLIFTSPILKGGITLPAFLPSIIYFEPQLPGGFGVMLKVLPDDPIHLEN
jgi:hypothetical protein